MTWSLLTIGQTAGAQEPEGKMVGMRMRWMPSSAEPAAGSLGHPDARWDPSRGGWWRGRSGAAGRTAVAGQAAAGVGLAVLGEQPGVADCLHKALSGLHLDHGTCLLCAGVPQSWATPGATWSRVLGPAWEYAPPWRTLQLASHQVTVFGGRGLEAHGQPPP